MRCTIQRLSQTLLVTLAAVAICFGNGEATTLEGQIIAYRPAERSVQFVSHVLNSEVFLFKLKVPNRKNSSVIVKLVYGHMGYSDISDDLLTKTPILLASVRRDNTCDETYASLVDRSPALNAEGSRGGQPEKIIYLPLFKSDAPLPGDKLACYKLVKWKFQIGAGQNQTP